MPSVFIVTKENQTSLKLQSELTKWGFTCLIANINEKVVERAVREAPELIILEVDGQISQTTLHELVDGSKVRRKMPIIAIMSLEALNSSSNYLGVDDFVILPFDSRELVARARRLIQKNTKSDETIRRGDLDIDLAN